MQALRLARQGFRVAIGETLDVYWHNLLLISTRVADWQGPLHCEAEIIKSGDNAIFIWNGGETSLLWRLPCFYSKWRDRQWQVTFLGHNAAALLTTLKAALGRVAPSAPVLIEQLSRAYVPTGQTYGWTDDYDSIAVPIRLGMHMDASARRGASLYHFGQLVAVADTLQVLVEEHADCLECAPNRAQYWPKHPALLAALRRAGVVLTPVAWDQRAYW